MDEKTARTELEKNDTVAEALESPAENAAPESQVTEQAPAEDGAAPEESSPADAPAEAPAEGGPESPAEEGDDSALEEKAGEEKADEEKTDTEEPLPAADGEAADSDAPLILGAEEQAEEETPAAPAPVPPAPGIAARLFNGLSFVGLPTLILFAAAMSFLEVWFVRDLWSASEVRLADTFMNLKAGDWMALTLNGMPYPDEPPLYFWLMEALTRIPGGYVTIPMVFFLAVAISHALFIASVWTLARGTGHDRRESFAAGLVALSCVSISGTAASPDLDLLFASIVALGMTCLYRGWIKPFAPFWLAAGFLLMALATFTKGPQGIAFAIVTSVLFLFWRGTPGRLNSRDGLPGFFLMLAGIGAWLGWLYLEGNTDYLRAMLMDQLTGRVLGDGHQSQVWWFYLAALPLLWLPFTLVVLFVNWFAVLRGIPSVWKTRKTNGGSSWLWIWLVTGAALLSCVQTKTAVYALPLLAPLAVLTGRSVMRLSPGRSRCFFGLTAALLALAGLALVLLDVYPALRGYIPAGVIPALPEGLVSAEMAASFGPWVEALDGTMYMGGILVLLAVALLFFTRLVLPGGALLVMALGMMALFQPYHYFVAPSLTPLLSPRAQAEAMASKVKEGYSPAACSVSPAAYAWHLNEIAKPEGKRLAVPDLPDTAALDAWLAKTPKAVVAMPKAVWDKWEGKPAAASVLTTQWMAHKPYVVAAIAAPEAPAPMVGAAPETPAEAPKAEASPEAPKPEAPAAATPEAPKAEAPAETSAPETPAAEAPAEPSAPEAPEAPKAEAPAAEAPKAETPAEKN